MAGAYPLSCATLDSQWWRQYLPHHNFFAGGGISSNTEISQLIQVGALAQSIDTGATHTLSEWLGGYANQDDRPSLMVTFHAGGGTVQDSVTIGPI